MDGYTFEEFRQKKVEVIELALQISKLDRKQIEAMKFVMIGIDLGKVLSGSA